MTHRSLVFVAVSSIVIALCVSAWAQEAKPAAEARPPAAGAEVTLKGVMMTEASCTPKPAKDADKTLVLFVVEGPPEVAATLDAILKENWPGDSINGDQARKIQEEFDKRLKYYITPGDLATKNQKNCRWGNPPMAVTGVVSEKDGKKWITPSRIEGTTLKYPDKMLAPDKPLVMPDKPPLVLKVTDKLSLKCIYVPAGKFMMHDPFYLVPRYDDAYPYLVTLTKPYYLAEIPVTQEMYEAVMGKNPSEQKGPQIPVRQVPCTDMQKFCQVLSEKNGRKVRLPTYAEWEFAARVGTSNPAFLVKYKDQLSVGPNNTPPPVKSRQPNAWGFYDMASCCWELTSDKWGWFGGRNDAVDPSYLCTEEEKTGKKHSHWGKGNIVSGHWTIGNHEGIGDGSGTGYGSTKFRVAVDAEPAAPAAAGN